MQVGFYFDQTRCTGCSACRVACKDWNDIPAGPENWMRVLYTEKGKFPKPFVSYMIAPCWHCVEPVCAAACPVDAITKREEDGIVLVDSDACLGSEECDVKCLKACPYDAPQFGPEKALKCTSVIFVWIDTWKASCRTASKPALFAPSMPVLSKNWKRNTARTKEPSISNIRNGRYRQW
jgi:anaerobic dimethyl sulfoxide reductase subunit B (iron-sulfur subunit)